MAIVLILHLDIKLIKLGITFIFPILSPILVSELDEPVEHHHVGVDLPGEHEELVGEGRVVSNVTRVMTALHTGCQLDKP